MAYIRESRDVLRTSASRFSAFEYFYNRSSVAAAMQQELTEALSRWHANVEAFQLLEYQLPSSFAIAIENTEVARQEVEQMLALTLTPTLTLTLTRWPRRCYSPCGGASGTASLAGCGGSTPNSRYAPRSSR